MTQQVAFQNRREIFRRMAEIAKVSSLTPEQARLYEADIKNARDYYNELEGSRIEGRETGFAEGREEGRAEGRAEGLWEQAVRTARKLMGLKLNDAIIGEVTGLTPEQLASIRKE